VEAAAALTWMAKAARAVECVPSLTWMTMSSWEPTSEAEGVPESCPVAALKAAQEGLLSMEKVRASPSASEACGVKE